MERVDDEKTGNSSLRPTKDGVLFYKRFASSANCFELRPECKFSYGFGYGESNKGRKGQVLELKPEPRFDCTQDGIPDYAHSLISFAFYQLLEKYSHSGTRFHHKICPKCGRGFYCTKAKAKYCSTQCRESSKERTRHIPGVGPVTEVTFQEWRRVCQKLGHTPSEKWNQAWFKSRNR